MDIQDLGAVGELVSSIAVLITLVYPAIQVKTMHLMMDANSHQARAECNKDIMMSLADSPELVEIGPHFAADENSLADVERRRFEFAQVAIWQTLKICIASINSASFQKIPDSPRPRGPTHTARHRGANRVLNLCAMA